MLFRFSCFDLNDLDGRPFLFLWVWLSDFPQMFIEKKSERLPNSILSFYIAFRRKYNIYFLAVLRSIPWSKTKGFTLWWDNQLWSHQGTSLSEENNYLDKLQPVKNTIFLIFANKLLTKNEKQFLPQNITAIEMFWFILVTLVCDYRHWNMQSWISCRRSNPKSISWFSM